MASLEELRNERIKKLELLKEAGMPAYPAASGRSTTLLEANSSFSKFSKRKKIILSGRITALRGQGSIIFFDFFDGTGSFQGLLKKDEMDEKSFSLFSDTVDIGDFVEAEGKFFVTKRKEKTIAVSGWRMLAKSLRPLPDKWHGLTDTEERFRRRYLDILMSKEVRARFEARSGIISFVRQFLEKNGYMEVETPMFQPLYGGASAVPFTTYYNALDTDFYLRISPELYLKRLLSAGFHKIFELNRNFRNEGIDATHSPEFTMLEFYTAYETASGQMVFVEKMLKELVKKTFNKTTFVFGGADINMGGKFSIVTYRSLLKKFTDLKLSGEFSRRELESEAERLGVEIYPGDTDMRILDNIYKKACRPKLIQPTFVVDYPEAMLPLAKRKEGKEKSVDAFQLIIGGMEIVKSFSELNDPIEQRERLEKEEKGKKLGDKEAQSLDEDFLEAMEYGMPPAGGVGMGIDRLVMLLTDSKNIREVILFPTMRPR